MKEVQLFKFNTHSIMTMKDADGNVWFLGKDICESFGDTNYRRSLSRIDSEDKTSALIQTVGGNQKMTFVNESGMYSLLFLMQPEKAKKKGVSHTDPIKEERIKELKSFKRWVTHEVLPSIRKTGSYTLSSLLLPDPRKWEKTFPTEFMRQVMKLYGYEYEPKTGTPSFVGKFIIKYVYDTLDKKMTKALKTARRNFGGDDEVSFLHQFLNDDARVGLQQHIVAVTTLASATSTIEGFDAAFSNVYQHKNQLRLYIR